MNSMKQYENEKKAFDQHGEKVDKQFNDFRAAVEERFNRRVKDRPIRHANPITQSPWFDALQNGKM